MSSPCITLQGSASNSWKWLIAGQLWFPWNRNQFSYWQFVKRGHTSALRGILHCWIVSCLSITSSLDLGKTLLNGKGDGGTGAWSLQTYLCHSTEGGNPARGKKAIRHFKSRKLVDTSSKTQNLSVFMGWWDSASRPDHKPWEHWCMCVENRRTWSLHSVVLM